MAALFAPAAAQGAVKAGVGVVDATWHVGASAGQYATGTPDEGAQTGFASVHGSDPHHHSTRRAPSYGVQSRLSIRALVVEGPGGPGERVAILKNDFYIPQDLIWRRAAQIIESKNIGIDKTNFTMAVTHNHSSPFYASTSWGVWTFQDVFDFRFFEYYAQRMAKAVEEAVGNLKPVRVGAAVKQFDWTQRNAPGPTTDQDDATPAGYPRDYTSHDMVVIRFDDISGGSPKPLASLVNYSLHPEFLEGNDLISADYLGPLERLVGRMTDAPMIWTQGAVGNTEPERSEWHNVNERAEFSHRDYAQSERGARRMAETIRAAWNEAGSAGSVVPFGDNFPVRMMDRWFPGPLSHPYPGVSSCTTDQAFAGNPRAPIVGFPDCEGLRDNGVPQPIDPGLDTDDIQRLGIPFPENYSAPSYTGLQEDVSVHLQAIRLGDILITVCSCEQWADQYFSIRSRANQTAGDIYKGYDWSKPDGADEMTPRTTHAGCTQTAPPDGPWECPNPHNQPKPGGGRVSGLSDAGVKKMKAQVNNDAAGWNDPSYVAHAESEPTDPNDIKGNYTHTELPANKGYKLVVPLSMANDYNGYIVTYREYQRGDHYRKALTAWGPHSSDYMSTRLVGMGSEMNDHLPLASLAGPSFIGPGESESDALGDAKSSAFDQNFNDVRARGIGEFALGGMAAYEAQLPDNAPIGIVEHPADVERFAPAFFTWNGGSNYTDDPFVKVQRRVGPGPNDFEDYADQTGEVQTTLKFPQGPDQASYRSGNQKWEWTAHFEAFTSDINPGERGTGLAAQSTPPGTYRFVVDGVQRQGMQNRPYQFISREFQVRLWSGIQAEDFQRDGDGRLSFRVGPRNPRTASGITQEIGPIDYPDTYPNTPAVNARKAKFIRVNHLVRREGSSTEWYCFTCTFRPWLDFGNASTAKVLIEESPTVRREAVAQEGADGRWRTTETLDSGESAYVPAGCVQDAFGNFNGAPSRREGSGPEPTSESNACENLTRVPSISIDDVKVKEGDAGETTAKFTVTLSGARTQPVEVEFATADDTAKAPDDYEQRGGKVTFAEGDTSEALEIKVKGDTADEPDETFVVNLANASAADIADTQGVGTIEDDDATPATSQPGGDSGGGGGGSGGGGGGGGGGQPGGGRVGDVLGQVLGSRCVRPVGRLRGKAVGRAQLGRGRRRNRRQFTNYTRPRGSMDRFCLADGRHTRIGYPPARLLKRLGRGLRRRVKGEAVLIMTSSAHYDVGGVRPGDTVRELRRRFGKRVRGPFRIGKRTWYLVRSKASTYVFKARGGAVLEVGVANRRLARGRLARRFLRSFR